MDLFNSVRRQPITIDTYTFYLPNLSFPSKHPARIILDKTPQMLFKKLKDLKKSNDKESSCIVIDQSKKTIAPLSHGECE